MAVTKKVVKAKKPVPKMGKKKDAVDLAVDNVSATWKFVKPNFRELFTKMFKLNLFAFGVVMGLILVFLLLFAGTLVVFGLDLTALETGAGIADIMSNTAALAILVILTIVFFIVMSWISQAFELVAPIIMDEQHTRKRSDLKELVCSMKMPALRYMIVSMVIGLVAVLVPMALTFILGIIGQTALFSIGIIIWLIWLFIFAILFSFLSQFWTFEIAVAKRPVVEALKASIDIVKKNVIGVLVFDILTIVIGLVLAVPFIGIVFVIEAIFRVSLLATFMAPGTGIIIGIIGVAIYVLIRIVLQLLAIALNQSTLLAYTYSYWKELRK